MTENELFIFNNYNEKLFGLKTIPKVKKNKYKTIILVSGFGVDRNNNGIFTDLSEGLTKEGYLIYRFNFSGCGNSQGNYAKTTITKLTNELESIYEFVNSEKEVDSENIAIIGNCTGSIITYNSNINPKATILINAHYDIYSVIKKLFLENLNIKGTSIRISSKGIQTTLDNTFWKDIDLNHKNIINKIEKLKSPTLFIHSGNSNLVSFEEAEKLYKLTKAKKAIVKIENADHNFTLYRTLLLSNIIRWLNKYLV